MSIVAQCPHCETKFNLGSEMAGKSMRCPNLDCRMTFTVKAGGRPTEPPPPPPPEPTQPPPRPAAAKPRKPEKAAAPAKPAVVEAKVVEAKVVEAAVVSPPKVKEVVWSEGTDVPPPKAKKPKGARPEEEPEPDDAPILRRKKKKERGPWVLIALVTTVVVLVGFVVIFVLNSKTQTEGVLAADADKVYKDKDYAGAKAAFERLAATYPKSPNAARYTFFAELAALQLAARQSDNKDNPDPAVQQLKSFIAAHKDTELAKDTAGPGNDVHAIGRTIAGDVVAFADKRVDAYRTDRAANAAELDRALKAVATGRELLPLVEPFRGADEPLDAVRAGLDRVVVEVGRENARTEAIRKAAAQLEKLSEEVVQSVEGDLAAAGLKDDADAKSLLAAARARLRETVRYDKDPADAGAVPANTAASVLFVTPVGPTRRPVPVGDNVPPSVFLAVARGLLYALDEDTGSLLWAARVGPDVTDPPAVARVNLDGGPADLAVVTSSVGGEFAVAGYVVKTGVPRWYQPLPAPAAGPAVVVGGRAYVAVRDTEGSVYDFDLTTGARLGRFRLAQTAGPPPVLRPGTGLLYVAADARRVFVFDVGAKDDDGATLDPRCVQILTTGHPPGTLRTPPVLIGPDGNAPGERWMVLAQADGPTTTLLRAFSIQPPPPTSPDGKPPEETVLAPAVELPVPGWVWFAPTTDGERLALVTDAGQFRVFGVNQPGNFDSPLFPLQPAAAPGAPQGVAVPGLVIPAEESAYWVMESGKMRKYRLGLVPSSGLKVLPVGGELTPGIPTQAPQLNNRRNAACLVVRSPNAAGSRAVLVSLHDGEVRWQRQLGVLPAVPPISHDGGVVLVAEDGGIVSLPATGAAVPGQTTVAPPAWVIADAPENTTGPTAVAVSPDGKTIYTVTPVLVTEESKPVAKWLIRRVAGGQVTHRGTAPAPGTPAGPPAVLGDSLLVPVADGFVYRHTPAVGKANSDTLTVGPPWGGERRTADAVCYITPLTDAAFLTNDGGNRLNQWDWPKGGRHAATGSGWELRERLAGPGVVLPPAATGQPSRVLLADVTGSVAMYAADRPGQQLRRWRPGSGLPTGKPSSPFVVQPGPANRTLAAYTVGNKFVVCIDPENDAPSWSVKPGDDPDATLVGPPAVAGAGRWLVGDLAGRVVLLEADGAAGGERQVGLPGAVPSTGVGSVGGGILIPLSDGSTVALTQLVPEPKAKE